MSAAGEDRVIAKAAIEIITECRDALGLQRGAQLTEFCKKVAAFNDQASWEEYDDHVAARSVAFAGDDDLRAEHHHTEMLALRAALLRSPSVLAAPLSQQPTGSDQKAARILAVELLEARAALVGLVGTDDPEALREMNSLMSVIPMGPDEGERAGILAAVRFLIDTQRDWQPIATAPRGGTWVIARVADGRTYVVHWAQDLSGEEQPPFRGWFEQVSAHGYREIPDPVSWCPLVPPPR